jgi:hypothetical protein
MDGTRNIKDSLFTALFNNEEAARELFNAVHGGGCGPEVEIAMTTLDDALYRGIKNDVSFIAGDVYMVLFEQQSSFSRNLPLRMLLYTARLYERLIPNKEVHKDKLLNIPRPCLAVLYTGRDSGKSAMKGQDRVTLRLSDAFKGGPNRFGSLELEVPVLNIMPGRNEDLLSRSPLLRGYTAFIARLREQEKTLPRTEAVLAVVDWCIAHGILADFFRKHRKEVSNMILNELTNEDALQAVREEERQHWEEERQHWEEAQQQWEEAQQQWEEERQHWEEERQRIRTLVQQGLSGAQLEQAIERIAPPAVETTSSSAT